MPTPSILSSSELASAVQFRTEVGLRADEAWILKVAVDPAAIPGLRDYGTPLTPAEKAELDSRAANADALAPVIARYGREHSGEYAGSFIDVKSGTFVVRFTGSLDDHRARLARLIRPGASLEIRAAEWSLEELTRRQRDVETDLGWLSSISAWFAGSGVDVVENRVVLELSSANPDAGHLALEHYGGDGWLTVESDGIGRWDGPLGNLTIDAVTRSGQPAPFLDCVLTPDDPSAAHTVEAYGTGDTGRCSIESVAATTYLVELKMLPPGGSGWVVVGSTRVGVPALLTESITVPVDLP